MCDGMTGEYVFEDLFEFAVEGIAGEREPVGAVWGGGGTCTQIGEGLGMASAVALEEVAEIDTVLVPRGWSSGVR